MSALPSKPSPPAIRTVATSAAPAFRPGTAAAASLPPGAGSLDGAQHPLTRASGVRRLRGDAEDEVQADGHERQDQGRPDRGPEEVVDGQVIRDRIRDVEQDGVDDDREEAEREDRERERDDPEEGPDDGVDHAEQQRDPEVRAESSRD